MPGEIKEYYLMKWLEMIQSAARCDNGTIRLSEVIA